MQLFFGGVLILSLPLALVLLGCTEREIADLDVVAQEVEAEGLASEDLEPDRYEFQATPCAQSVQDVDFIEWMTETIPALPPADSDTYLAPTFLEKQQFKAAAAALLEGRCQSAWSLAGQAGFRVVELRDKAARYLYLEPLDRVQKARGIFLVRVHDQWDSEVVMEAPHPLFDQGTGLLAAMAFAQGNFAALAIAGTHRCANIDYGQADGKTRVCNEGLRHPYRESDMAHAAQSYFQAFHEAFVDTLPEGFAVQLHAFAQGDDDPLFIVADGTTEDAPLNHPSNRLYLALLDSIADAGYTPVGASCNLADHADSLCATTNVQGRYSNGVAPRHVARREAVSATGRFLHLELGTTLRFTGGDLDGRPVIQALKAAL